eukprot:178011-Karenia_brevis.AAC.1
MAYVSLLVRLYEGQAARVKTDKLSRRFLIGRGTKQGDPLSSLIFNSVLEYIMSRMKQKWQSRRYGLKLGATSMSDLTNLRFADDVLLFARTQLQVKKMLADVQDEAAKCGLQLHPDKTKIFTNVSKRRGNNGANHVTINDMNIEILAWSSSTKYLGRLVGFDRIQELELDNRIRQAWKSFMANKSELTCKHYCLRSRL